MSVFQNHRDIGYLVPTDLSRTGAPVRRALLIGGCMSAALPLEFDGLFDGATLDFLPFGNVSHLPERPPQPVQDYDFQIVQLPLRSILGGGECGRLAYNDLAAHEAFFEDCLTRLRLGLEGALRFNAEHGLLSFVCNFLAPQQNAFGRLMPRYDIRNPVHLVERLNQALVEEISGYSNCHLLDADQISANFGRRLVQDDHVWGLLHGSVLSEYDHALDQGRIEPPPKMAEYYDSVAGHFNGALLTEVRAMYRTIRQADLVKLVVVDLDDTLWRGVLAEGDEVLEAAMEGWPLGVAEALCFLKQRGVLLSIISKNDEALVRRRWNEVTRGALTLEDFAVCKINWASKAENMDEVLTELNLLPRNAVFIDDNPRERELIQASFPDMRVLGQHPYLLRRILLWSAETQVAVITDESARRTDMIQGQIRRESTRRLLTREEFLASLGLEVEPVEIARAGDPSFARAFELLNKTNQFNTTGVRWSREDLSDLLERGGRLHALKVKDRFVDYGLVAVGVTRGGELLQFVMSCRVIGLDVEVQAIGRIVEDLGGRVLAHAALTDANLLSRDLYERCGFTARDDGAWLFERPAPALAI